MGETIGAKIMGIKPRADGRRATGGRQQRVKKENKRLFRKVKREGKESDVTCTHADARPEHAKQSI